MDRRSSPPWRRSWPRSGPNWGTTRSPRDRRREPRPGPAPVSRWTRERAGGLRTRATVNPAGVDRPGRRGRGGTGDRRDGRKVSARRSPGQAVAGMDSESGPADGMHQGGRDRCQDRQPARGPHDRRRRPIVARAAAGGRGRGEDPPARVVADRHRDQGTAGGDRLGLGTRPVQADLPRGGRQGGPGGPTFVRDGVEHGSLHRMWGRSGCRPGLARSATIPRKGEAGCAPPSPERRRDRGGRGSSWRMCRDWGRHDPDHPPIMPGLASTRSWRMARALQYAASPRVRSPVQPKR
jgi:hypothetical protein